MKRKRNDRPTWGTLHSALLSLYLNTKCGCGGRACEQCRAAVEEAVFALGKHVKAK
jgi:ferredoxin